MNCFQLFIFDILTTTEKISRPSCDSLWIAFNYLSLTFWQQQNLYTMISEVVVNCFQLFIFDILTTTGWQPTESANRLWIAFNYLSLTFWQQPTRGQRILNLVVNCFQLFIFDILTTTMNISHMTVKRLWIAFNYLSLTFWQQLFG